MSMTRCYCTQPFAAMSVIFVIMTDKYMNLRTQGDDLIEVDNDLGSRLFWF